MASYDIDILHEHILQILLSVDKVCREHDLTYYCWAGTMLGAIRHKGFIPWDDDLDIEMMRKDYLRLMKVLPKELPNWLALQNDETDPTTSSTMLKCAIAAHECWNRLITTEYGKNRAFTSTSSPWNSTQSGCIAWRRRRSATCTKCGAPVLTTKRPYVRFGVSSTWTILCFSLACARSAGCFPAR